MTAPPLVGRDAELAAGLADYVEVAGGGRRTLLVTGSAGIGKTRLCAELAASCVAAGAQVLTGGCPPAVGADLAYAPFLAAWRAVPGPGFADRLAELAALGELPADVGRAWLCARLLDDVDRLSADRPLVLVIEDAHWIDRSSMVLVQMLARSGSGRRLLIVTARHDSAEPLDAALLELAALPTARRVHLGPLDDVATARLVRVIAADAEDRLVRSVVRRSGGHPYFATELAAERNPDALPATLHGLLRARIVELGPAGPQLLAAVTAAGDAATPDLLATVTGVDIRPELAAAIRHGLLVADRPAGPVRLRHEVLGEVAAAELLPGTIARLHAAVAGQLAAAGDRVPAATLARHWERAGEPDRAASAWLAAGRQATEGHAHHEAAAAFLRALELAGGLGGGPAGGVGGGVGRAERPGAAGWSASERVGRSVRRPGRCAPPASWIGRSAYSAARSPTGHPPAQPIGAGCSTSCMSACTRSAAAARRSPCWTRRPSWPPTCRRPR